MHRTGCCLAAAGSCCRCCCRCCCGCDAPHQRWWLWAIDCPVCIPLHPHEALDVPDEALLGADDRAWPADADVANHLLHGSTDGAAVTQHGQLRSDRHLNESEQEEVVFGMFAAAQELCLQPCNRQPAPVSQPKPATAELMVPASQNEVCCSCSAQAV